MKVPEADRLKRVFDLTPEKWQRMFDFQNGCCAMCGKKFGDEEIILTDHNHKNGLVRGLLCFVCNGILGEGVTPELLRSGSAYLSNPPASRALGYDHYGLPGRVDTKAQRKIKHHVARAKRRFQALKLPATEKDAMEEASARLRVAMPLLSRLWADAKIPVRKKLKKKRTQSKELNTCDAKFMP